MKSYILILTITLSFFYSSGFHLKVKPFKIYFDDLPNGIGLIFLVLSLTFFQYSSHKQGVKEGYQKAIDDIIEYSKNNSTKS